MLVTWALDLCTGTTVHRKRLVTCDLVLGTVTAAHREEVGYVVPKRAIVGVLLQSHDLDRVVSELANAGKHCHAEVQVAVHPGLLTGHANVALVDA